MQEKLRITIVGVLLGLELLVELGDDETTEGGITFLVGLWVLELALEQRLPISKAVWVAKFLLGKGLYLLEEYRSALGIFAISLERHQTEKCVSI